MLRCAGLRDAAGMDEPMPSLPDAMRPGRRALSTRTTMLLAGATLLLGSLVLMERPLTAPLSGTIEIADLTWVEVRGLVEHGYTTAIVPSGGLEQNGPHMVIGKHDRIVAWTAHRIAADLGHALVTPVVSFVPEGRHWPPTGHLRFPGTIGVTDEVFAGILDGVARSLKAAGFRTICFIADHGASLKPQREVAERLNAEWAKDGIRVVSVDEYYADGSQIRWLEARGETADTIGLHGGIQDTSELMAVHPEGVKLDRAASGFRLGEETGSNGDPTRASAERGRKLLDIKIEAAVARIKAVLAGS